MREEKIGVTILTIVFLLLVISLFFLVEPEYTGRVVGECTDTDNGQDVYVAGTTDDGTTTHNDACADASNVQEGYCDTAGVNIATLPCPAGYECSNGQCNQQTQSSTSTTSTSSSTSSSSSTIDSTTTSVGNQTTTTSIGNQTTTTSVGNGTTSSSSSTSSTSSTSSSTSTSTGSSSTSTSSSTTTTAAAAASSESETLCTPKWECDPVGDCVNGVQKTICRDLNDCGFADREESEKCTAEAPVEETLQATQEQTETSTVEAGPTGRAVTDTTNLGTIAASAIWATVALGGLGFVLNKYNPRWWVKTKFGAGTAWHNMMDYSKAGFYRARYSMKSMFGKKGM